MPEDPAPASPPIRRAGRDRVVAPARGAAGLTQASNPWAVASLVAVNLVPLVGVASFGWSLFDLMLLYWFENGVIGLFTIVKMLLPRDDVDGGRSPLAVLGQLFTAAFFTVHYGLFWTVHGIFVVMLFGGGVESGFVADPGGSLGGGIGLAAQVARSGLAVAVLGLFASHAVSFVTNVLQRGEGRLASVQQLMSQPYGRVVVLHVTLVLGAFPILALGEPMGALLLFVALKIGIDLAAHLASHRRRATA